MTVLLLERVSPGLRGELSRWMLEPKAGVFVGKPTAGVRDRLWQAVCRQGGVDSGCVMITQASNEQGFRIETCGRPSRPVVDFEGLLLVKSRV